MLGSAIGAQCYHVPGSSVEGSGDEVSGPKEIGTSYHRLPCTVERAGQLKQLSLVAFNSIITLL